MDAKTLAADILRFNANRGGLDEPTLWPAFYGPSGSGKTSRAVAIAKELGMPLRRLLLGTMQDAEVLGLPRAVQEEGGNWKTIWSWPEWALDKPFILFLDELDKARPDVLSAVLTLLAERRIRDVPLPEGSLVMAALQPVDKHWLMDESAVAIAARLVWLPTGKDRNHLEQRWGADLSWLPEPQSPWMPILGVPTDRQLDWALAWISQRPRESWEPVLSGIFSPEVVEGMIRMAESVGINADAIAKALIEDPKRIKRLGLDRLGRVMVPLAMSGPEGLPAFEALLKRLLSEGSPETVYAAMRNFTEELARIASNNGGSVEIFGNAAEDTVVSAIERACTEAYKARKK